MKFILLILVLIELAYFLIKVCLLDLEEVLEKRLEILDIHGELQYIEELFLSLIHKIKEFKLLLNTVNTFLKLNARDRKIWQIL